MPNNTLASPFFQAEENRALHPGPGVEPEVAQAAAPSLISDEDILSLWTDIRKESIDSRKSFEIQWRRNIYYVLNRQWIEYIAGRGWRDKRIAPWIPRPVTNKCKETVQAIRAMFTSIKLGVNVRPNGADPKNVSAASTADQLAPVLHEAHEMNANQAEFDFWFITCGNAFYHTFLDYDVKYGVITDATQECVTCGAQAKDSELTGAQAVCPECQGTDFQPAIDETGEPIVDIRPKGQPITLVLSPLELAFSNSYARFSDLPYVVRLRWRTKRYFESNPALAALVEGISWEKSPSDQNLNLFQSMATNNDLGMTAGGYASGNGTAQDEEGISEYEVWMKPTLTYPEGLVFRVYGDRNPIVAHLEEQEALPGPLPYKDADGSPLFTFTHAAYDHVGGRILGSGPLDAIIEKQDALNRLDSMNELVMQRMANPVWSIPKGSEISKFTGMAGQILRWNSNVLGGNAKPERIPGIGPDASMFTMREQYLKDIEDLAGTFDIVKGAKPTGVEAFSALQLLVERSQSRFSNAFQARGDAYKDWFRYALELEREFGPDSRTKAVLTPARSWTFQTFKRAQLGGSVSVIVEDGSTVPKTNLGMRAAVEHANQLGMLNMADPDQQYEGLKLFGLTGMIPTLDIHVQAALQKQQAFEQWVVSPGVVEQFVVGAQQRMQEFQGKVQMAQQEQATLASQPPQPGTVPPPTPDLQPPSVLEGSPLAWKPWYNPIIHRQEVIKWANSDIMRELFQTTPVAEKLVAAHLADIDAQIAMVQAQAMAAQAPPQGAKPKPGGSGKAMGNSNANSGDGQGTSSPA